LPLKANKQTKDKEMDLSNLKPAKGSVKKNKRLGRGEGSTKGGTSARGHNGQKSRSGYSKKVGFEGGQQPLQRRVPKFGFTNINRVEYSGVNLDTLQTLADTKKLKKIDKSVLIENGLVSKNDLIKILGRGEISTKIEVLADAYSATAKAAIEKQGGVAGLVTIKKIEEKPSKEKPSAKAKTEEAPKEKEATTEDKSSKE